MSPAQHDVFELPTPADFLANTSSVNYTGSKGTTSSYNAGVLVTGGMRR
jgi:hypothetical protein